MTIHDKIEFSSIQKFASISETSTATKATSTDKPIFNGSEKKESKNKGFDLSRKEIKTLEQMGEKGQKLLALLADFDSSNNSENPIVPQLITIRNTAIELLIADNIQYDKNTAKLLEKLGVSNDEYNKMLEQNYKTTFTYINVEINENNEIEYYQAVSSENTQNYSGKTFEIINYENDKTTYLRNENGNISEYTQVKDANGDTKFEQNSFEYLTDSTGAPLLDNGPVWELGSTCKCMFLEEDVAYEIEFTREAVKRPDGSFEMVLKDSAGGLYPIDENGQPVLNFGQTLEELYGDNTKMITDYNNPKDGAKLYDGSTLLFNGEIYEGSVIVEQDGTVIPSFINQYGEEKYLEEYENRVSLDDYDLNHTGAVGFFSQRWEVGNTVEGGYTTALTDDYKPVYEKDGKHYLVDPETGELARNLMTGEPILVE
ncbi:hypothetical protein IKJ53_03065 [bacterium]|nr:hypothetical protein [bacterium]